MADPASQMFDGDTFGISLMDFSMLLPMIHCAPPLGALRFDVFESVWADCHRILSLELFDLPPAFAESTLESFDFQLCTLIVFGSQGISLSSQLDLRLTLDLLLVYHLISSDS